MISHYPRILWFPVKRVSAVSRLLREKCQFTAQQMADILRDAPHVVEEEAARLEYKFQVRPLLFYYSITFVHVVMAGIFLFKNTTSCV